MIPRKPIDWNKLDLYLKAGSKQEKICEALGISVDTLQRRMIDKYGMKYTEYAHSLRSEGELLIEAMQFQKAMNGNIQMLMWLGKIRCGQREPDLVTSIPPLQNDLDKDHLIMQLQHKISLLEECADKPKAE